jgi:hypothetical protein
VKFVNARMEVLVMAKAAIVSKIMKANYAKPGFVISANILNMTTVNASKSTIKVSAKRKNVKMVSAMQMVIVNVQNFSQEICVKPST